MPKFTIGKVKTNGSFDNYPAGEIINKQALGAAETLKELGYLEPSNLFQGEYYLGLILGDEDEDGYREVYLTQGGLKPASSSSDDAPVPDRNF